MPCKDKTENLHHDKNSVLDCKVPYQAFFVFFFSEERHPRRSRDKFSGREGDTKGEICVSHKLSLAPSDFTRLGVLPSLCPSICPWDSEDEGRGG